MRTWGYVVGITRSGKSIYVSRHGDDIVAPHPATADFSPDDHFDAVAVFEFLVLRSKRRHGQDSAEYGLYNHYSFAHRKCLREGSSFEDAKVRAGCKSAFDLGKLGRRLARLEFHDI
jgi:hypothetical protein